MADSVPMASPRRSFQQIEKSKILIPEIRIEEQEDVVTEVARQMLQEAADQYHDSKKGQSEEALVDDETKATSDNTLTEAMEGNELENGHDTQVDDADSANEEPTNIETTADVEVHKEDSNDNQVDFKDDQVDSKDDQDDLKDNQVDSKDEQVDSKDDQVDSKDDQDDFKEYQDDLKDDQVDSKDDQVDSKENQDDFKEDQDDSQDDQEVSVISDNLIKAHFPELMQDTQEVYEVANNEGEVVEQWYTIEPEKVSNVDALEKLEAEADNEEDKADIKKLLAWAKSTKKKKTATMVIREKKKLDMFKKAVDVDAVPIIIEDNSSYDKHGNSSSRFQVKPTQQATFQVRRKSVIQPVSETVVTRSWLENAIRMFEDEQSVVLINMRFDRDKHGAYQAQVKAEVGQSRVSKSYDWIIKDAPNKTEMGEDDKDTFMIADFGTKLVRFVAAKQRGVRIPGQGNATAKMSRTLNMPFMPIIFADGQYAIFDNMAELKVQTDQIGFDLEHMKQALKTLARLHAMSYAFFNHSNVDVKDFSTALKLMINKSFHTSASPQDKAKAKSEIQAGFENLLSVLSRSSQGQGLAKKVKAKYQDRLYAIFKEAHAASSGSFSVLCHGYPVQENFMFSYKREEGSGMSFGSPVDAKLVKFQEARFGNAMTDVQLLLSSTIAAAIEDKGDFLLRFVYHETLISTLKSLGLDPPPNCQYDVMKADFKKYQAYGALAGAIHLANGSNKAIKKSKPVINKRVFQSKILGGMIGKGDPEVYETSGPELRAQALIENLVN